MVRGFVLFSFVFVCFIFAGFALTLRTTGGDRKKGGPEQ